MSTLPFGPYCPSGGTFYVCSGAASKSKFIGCCTADPCTSNTGCSAGNLRPASYDSKKHGTFADQECSSGLFYTCAANTPPFLGCCKSNPCGKGCSQQDLSSMFLSNDPAKADDFLPSSASTVASSTKQTSTGTATGTKSTGSETAVNLPLVSSSPTPESKSSLSTGAIIGLAVGAVLFLIILTAVIFFICGKRAKAKKLKRKGTFELVPQSDRVLSPPTVAEAFGHHDKKMGYSPYYDAFPSPAPQYQGSDRGMPSPPPAFDPRYSAMTLTDPRYSQVYSTDPSKSPMQSSAFELSAEPQQMGVGNVARYPVLSTPSNEPVELAAVTAAPVEMASTPHSPSNKPTRQQF